MSDTDDSDEFVPRDEQMAFLCVGCARRIVREEDVRVKSLKLDCPNCERGMKYVREEDDDEAE